MWENPDFTAILLSFMVCFSLIHGSIYTPSISMPLLMTQFSICFKNWSERDSQTVQNMPPVPGMGPQQTRAVFPKVFRLAASVDPLRDWLQLPIRGTILIHRPAKATWPNTIWTGHWWNMHFKHIENHIETLLLQEGLKKLPCGIFHWHSCITTQGARIGLSNCSSIFTYLVVNSIELSKIYFCLIYLGLRCCSICHFACNKMTGLWETRNFTTWPIFMMEVVKRIWFQINWHINYLSC